MHSSTAFSGIRLAGRGDARSFSLQYISVILIVLACVLGAFVNKPIEEETAVAAVIPENINELVVNPPIAERLFSNLFDEAGNLNQETLRTLAVLLGNHDLDAQIKIGAAREMPTPVELGNALNRARLVSEGLSQAGIPTSAFEVIVIESSNQVEVSVQNEHATR